MVMTKISKKNPHVLIVDDDSNLLMTLGEILNARGFESVCVSSGGGALKAIKSQDFDVALIDLKLEDISGLEVMRGIKALSPASECSLFNGRPINITPRWLCAKAKRNIGWWRTLPMIGKPGIRRMESIGMSRLPVSALAGTRHRNF